MSRLGSNTFLSFQPLEAPTEALTFSTDVEFVLAL